MSSGKSSFIGSYARFCLSGFGLGADAAKALGVVVLILTIVFVVAIYIIKWIVQLILRNKKNKEAAAEPAQQVTPKIEETAPQAAAEPATEATPEETPAATE
jgi:flagellar biosynthesis/type III secretory pathway M-ring protein FliF/YscJ